MLVPRPGSSNDGGHHASDGERDGAPLVPRAEVIREPLRELPDTWGEGERPLDKVDIASMESFPCSDSPGY